jgi:hypothetical protein
MLTFMLSMFEVLSKQSTPHAAWPHVHSPHTFEPLAASVIEDAALHNCHTFQINSNIAMLHAAKPAAAKLDFELTTAVRALPPPR